MESFSSNSTPGRLASFILATICAIASQMALAHETITTITSPAISRMINRSSVKAIYEDSSGFLWVATEQDLYRFDGSNSQQVLASSFGNSSFSISDVLDMAEDPQGNVLLATKYSGILRWSPAARAFQPLSHPALGKATAYAHITRDGANNIWVSSRKKLLVFDHSLQGRQNWIESDPAYPEVSPANVLTPRRNGDMLIGSPSGLYVASSARREIRKLLDDPPSLNISAIQSHLGRIYAGTDDGHVLVYELPNNSYSGSMVSTLDIAEPVSSISIFEDRVWIGTYSGIYWSDLNLHDVHPLNTTNSRLSDNYIISLTKSRYGIWIGTASGIDRISLSPLELFNYENSLVYNHITSFTEDRMGRIWVGTFNGLYLYDRGTGRHRRMDRELALTFPDPRVMAVEAADNQLWLGFWNSGVSVLDLDTLQPLDTRLALPESFSTTSILHDDSTGVWIGTFVKGVMRVFHNKVYSYPLPGGEPITAIHVDDSNRLYVASETQIFVYDKSADSFSQLHAMENRTQTGEIMSLSSTPEGRLLVGTRGDGVYISNMPPGGESRLSLSPFLKDFKYTTLSVYGIIPDQRGKYWLSTQVGIIVTDGKGKFLRQYQQSDGLQADDFTFGAHLKSTGGELYFGGPHGYNKITPGAELSPGTTPPVILTGLSTGPDGTHLNYDEIKSLTEFEIPPASSQLEFSFSMVDFLNPDKNRYKYRLAGFDADWIDNGTANSATYTSLPPGEYTLQVIAANAAGVWNNEGVKLNIRVLSPWWWTWWAYACYVALALAFLTACLRIYRTSVLKEQALRFAGEMQDQAFRVQNELEEQQELQDGVVKAIHHQNMSTLELVRTSMSASSGAAGFESKVLGHIRCLEILEDGYYYQSGHLLADLHGFTDTLATELLRQSPIDSTSITTINNIRKILLPAQTAAPLAIIIYELLENALVHAFDGSAMANYIEVKLDFNEVKLSGKACCELSVSDDGRGIDDAIDPLTANSPGFSLVRLLSAKLGGELSCSRKSGTRILVRLSEMDCSTRA